MVVTAGRAEGETLHSLTARKTQLPLSAGAQSHHSINQLLSQSISHLQPLSLVLYIAVLAIYPCQWRFCRSSDSQPAPMPMSKALKALKRRIAVIHAAATHSHVVCDAEPPGCTQLARPST